MGNRNTCSICAGEKRSLSEDDDKKNRRMLYQENDNFDKVASMLEERNKNTENTLEYAAHQSKSYRDSMPISNAGILDRNSKELAST